MSARELAGDDPRSHEKVIEIKELHKTLAESQTKQVEFQAELAKRQANTQQQIIEIPSQSSNSTSGTNNLKQQEEETANNATETNGIRAEFVFGKHKRLFEALKSGDSQKATKYLMDHDHLDEVIKEAISEDLYTVLHQAVYWNLEMKFIKEIVELMKSETLEYKTSRNSGGDNAVHIAAFRGNYEAIVTMVRKNPKLALIRNEDDYTPLEIALLFVTPEQKKIVEYLYLKTEDGEPSLFLGENGAKLLCHLIDADFYDMALRLVKQFPKLVSEKSITHKMCGLEFLVRKPLAFSSGTKLSWCQKRVSSVIQVKMNSKYVHLVEPNTCQSTEPPERFKDITAEEGSKVSSTINKGIPVSYLPRVPYIMNIYNQKVMHQQATALLKQMLVGLRDENKLDADVLTFFQSNPKIIEEAIKLGTIEFLEECIEHFGFLIWKNMGVRKMIEMAIAERDATIVDLICDSGDEEFEDKITLLSTIDDDGNTILHHAAELAPSAKLNLVSGVALQIQLELQWFKGVTRMLKINYKDKRNSKGLTAQSIFTTAHKELVKEGEKWMKDTSGSCMLVAALIATVAFAAAFTVPGGNINDNNSSENGTPVFLGKTSFSVFVVADVFALFSSITSVLMFLAIYTSRFAEMDFLKSLPQKLIIGLTTLFISMASILVAFCAALLIIVGDKSPLSLILMASFGCIPVTLFAWLQLPLFYEMVRSTYWGSLFEQHKYVDPRMKKTTIKRKTE